MGRTVEFKTPPPRAPKAKVGARQALQPRAAGSVNVAPAAEEAPAPPPTQKRPPTAELTPRRRRVRRREKREHIVPDPCQRAEQLRLLATVLPSLEEEGSLHVHPEDEKPPSQLTRGSTLQLGTDEQWRVSRLLGEGTFAQVFLVTRDAERRLASLRQMRDGAMHGATEIWRRLSGGGDGTVGSAPQSAAAKVSTAPAQIWEFYVHEAIRKRVAHDEQRRFLLGLGAHAFGSPLSATVGASASVLLLPVCGPTLQNLLDKLTAPLPECLALFYAMELARALHALHAARLLHADVKPDNVAIRAPRKGPATIDATRPLTSGEWDGYGCRLFDFGRGVDLSLYEAGTRFQGDVTADGFECMEMRRRQTWTFQVDSFALCATAHALLHEPEKMHLESREGRWRPREQRGDEAPRIWQRLYDEALNVPTGGPHPNLALLASTIEAHFDAKAERRVALKEALMQQQSAL